MFVDNAKVYVSAGRGGDGRVSFRTEKYVDHGGPDGGDGGRGGNVIFEASDSQSTLVDFRIKKELKAEDGQAGSMRRRHGKSGSDRIIAVPVGTQVLRDGELIADLVNAGQQVTVAKGGDGGFGNAHFKSSTRQAPRVAELGEKGEAFEAELELKLVADVGLVGFPNAGKSTFLSVVSSARPAIADYAFTTLTPNLGVADIDNTSILIADIPGLIEGASEGKGLGDAFLKHIERTAVIFHLIDAYQEDPGAAYRTIRNELESYGEHLIQLPEVIGMTKVEGLDDEIIAAQVASIEAVVEPGTSVIAFSSTAGINVQQALRTLASVVASERSKAAELLAADEPPTDQPVIQLSEAQQDDAWKVRIEEGSFVVTGPKIEKFAARTDYGNIHSVNRLRDIMKKLGITHDLTRKGAESADMIIFGNRGEYRMTLDEL